MATLRLARLAKHFGVVRAVDDVDLEVGHGELVCLLGPSGCGKSTALRMIGGLEEPTSGQVVIDGEAIDHLPPNRRPTAMVFQKYTLWPHMPVFKNIAFGLQLKRLPTAEIRAKVAEALELVGLEGYERRYPSQLSGGQQQRVAIARALVLEPKILLMDEPFSSLDAHLRVRLRDELKQIQRRLSITTVFVTHDQEEALSLADRIAVMNEGRIDQYASPEEVYAHPASLFAAGFIGTMTMAPGVVEDGGLRLGEHPAVLAAPGVASGAVKVAIRPEDTVVVRVGDGDAAGVAAGVAAGDAADVAAGAAAGDASSASSGAAGALDGAGSSFAARVERVLNLGPTYHLHLDVPGVGVVKASAPRSMRPVEGEEVRLELRRYLVYPELGGPGMEVVVE